ncbi:hypothetical protein [Histidinibacterium aquaticum]|uniref:hypothetical protein n=1 Tax=Histidinibacterium aquaticum TaxID=2613962 RepID=UPI00168B5287|nr:hypothetical protein [Histidinibacterium aquaticum]
MFDALLPFLAFGTLVGVLILARISKRRTDDLRHDPNHKKSSLAKDGPGPRLFN